jgi:hypothetical protein
MKAGMGNPNKNPMKQWHRKNGEPARSHKGGKICEF